VPQLAAVKQPITINTLDATTVTGPHASSRAWDRGRSVGENTPASFRGRGRPKHCTATPTPTHTAASPVSARRSALPRVTPLRLWGMHAVVSRQWARWAAGRYVWSRDQAV